MTWSPENAEFLAVGPGGIVSSPDGVTWTSIANPAANTWLSVVWSAALTRYVGVASAGTNRALVGIVPTAPGAPIGLAAVVNGDDIALSWTTPVFAGSSPVTGYRIERSADGGAFAVLVADTASTQTAYDDVDTRLGVTYVYRVIALNAAGAGAASNDATARRNAPELAATGSDLRPVAVLAMALLACGILVAAVRRAATR